MLNRLHSLLNKKSIVKVIIHPSTKNTIHALFYVLIALPLWAVLFAGLLVRRTRNTPIRAVAIAPESAFSFMVSFLELLRARSENGETHDLIIILDRWGHTTLSALYSEVLGCKISNTRGLRGMFWQALMLQPSWLVSLERLDWRDLRQNFQLPRKVLQIPKNLSRLGDETAKHLDLNGHLVAMAVYASGYDDERSPYKGYSRSRARLETIGRDLEAGVDYLMSRGCSPVLLGSPDSGRARIGRKIPRLTEFGSLGGAHEVAIASRCHYFWTEAAGAWWLSFPFRRPVLVTNEYNQRVPWNDLTAVPHLVVPIRFQDSSGKDLSLVEGITAKPPFQKREDLLWIRNSPEEIVDAHREMLARLAGTWIDSDEVKSLRSRYEKHFEQHPQLRPLQIASTFLERHPHLFE